MRGKWKQRRRRARIRWRATQGTGACEAGGNEGRRERRDSRRRAGDEGAAGGGGGVGGCRPRASWERMTRDSPLVPRKRLVTSGPKQMQLDPRCDARATPGWS